MNLISFDHKIKIQKKERKNDIRRENSVPSYLHNIKSSLKCLSSLQLSRNKRIYLPKNKNENRLKYDFYLCSESGENVPIQRVSHFNSWHNKTEDEVKQWTSKFRIFVSNNKISPPSSSIGHVRTSINIGFSPSGRWRKQYIKSNFNFGNVVLFEVRKMLSRGTGWT